MRHPRDEAYLSRRLLLLITGSGAAAALLTALLSVREGLSFLSASSAALVLAYGGLAYVLQVVRPNLNLKPVTLAMISAQCGTCLFGAGFHEVQLSAVILSLVMWLLMYHDACRLRVIGGVHVAIAIALLAFGPPPAASLPWLTQLIFVCVVLAFVTATVMSIESNGRHWAQMERLEAELRRNEEQLHRTAAQLTAQHAELQTAAAALQVTAAANAPRVEALRRAYEEQSHIAEAASSGLRQPLRNINQFVQLIRRRLKRLGIDDSVTDYLDFVTDGAARMTGMVDDLLRYSDTREVAEAVPVDTTAVLASIRDNLSDLLAREGATLAFAPDLPTVSGHPTQVLQLFQNLISNGVKFKRPGVAPRCEVTCVVEDGVAGFRVSDNGIGIPADRLADVFGLFTRLHERGAYEGTGIGLATCRRIVMAAGGEIWAESVEGEGTTFCFTWPLSEGLAPKPAATAPSAGADERESVVLPS